MPQFTPPVEQVRETTDRFWRRMSTPRGLAVVLYDDGRVLTTSTPPLSDEDGVSVVWGGGRTYTITDAQSAVLTEAGYGGCIA